MPDAMADGNIEGGTIRAGLASGDDLRKNRHHIPGVDCIPVGGRSRLKPGGGEIVILPDAEQVTSVIDAFGRWAVNCQERNSCMLATAS